MLIFILIILEGDFQSMSLVGCYIDQNPNRTMDSDPFLVDASTNTIESCVSNCTISHNEHAGVENGYATVSRYIINIFILVMSY